MLEKYLQDLGLTDKEAGLYVTMLGMDNASVLELSKKTKINRTTVYLVLESLMKKGLASEIQIDKKTHYQAEPPERLETYVERQKIVLEEQAKRVKDLIPQLKSVERESGERPVVKYFEGREGIISSLEEFLKGPKTEEFTYLLYPKDLVDEIFTEEEKRKYRGMRLTKKIKSQSLYTLKNGELQSDEMATRIKIDGNKYPITCDISIYGDRMRINVLGKGLASIFIQSKDVAETFKSLFKLALDNIKK